MLRVAFEDGPAPVADKAGSRHALLRGEEDDVGGDSLKFSNKRTRSTIVTGSGLEKADVDIGTPNIYASVMVAAFGGVNVHVHGGKKAKVHPILLLILCFPVVSAQVSILLYLRVSLDWEAPMKSIDGADGLGHLKILLVIISYLMNFQPLMQSVKQFIFIANPLTWVEVDHAEPHEWIHESRWFSWIFHVVFLLPWPFIAVLMNIWVNYLVCTESLSVILSSADPQAAIFNSLAIAFIADLGAHWWTFCAYLFHLESFEHYEFSLKSTNYIWEDGDTDELTEKKKATMMCLCPIRLLIRATTWSRFGMNHTFLRQGYGARRFAQLMGVTILGCVYCRQFFVVLHAVETETLPVTRDICTEYRMEVAGGASGTAFRLIERLLFVKSVQMLTDTIERNETMKAECNGGKYMRLTVDYAFNDLFVNYRLHILTFVAIMILVAFVPTALHMLHSYYSSGDEASSDTEEASLREPSELALSKQRVGRLEATVRLMQDDVDERRDRERRLEKQVAQLLGQQETLSKQVQEMQASLAQHVRQQQCGQQAAGA